MDIDLLNSSFANNLGELNIDMSTDTTLVASNTTSSTTEATTSGENIVTTSSSNETNTTKADHNTSSTVTNGMEDKKDILDFLNTEDLENNLKLFPFTDQTILLPANQKDLPVGADENVHGLSSSLSLLNNPTLADPSILSNPTANATTATVISTNTNANTNTTSATTAQVSTVPASTADMTLNHQTTINMNGVTTTATNAASIKVDTNIPPQAATHPNSGELLGAQNALLAIPPNMMNDPSAYYNMTAAGHPAAAGLPSNPAMPGATKVGYYPQPTPAGATQTVMVKAPTAVPGSQNEMMMKNVYNVKQENMNEIQKNQQNRDANVKNAMNNGNMIIYINDKNYLTSNSIILLKHFLLIIGKINEANPNVKVNMKR